MKTPPLLMFAALVFWGWQAHLLWEGAAAGLILEAARIIGRRWDLEDVDFNRIWSLCVLVMIVTFGYLFTTNDQGGGLAAMTHGAGALRNVSTAVSAAAYSVLRWLPLICFPFVMAQAYNVRPSVPLTAVSMVLRIRRRRGQQWLAGRYLDVSHAYFIFCIFSAGMHGNQGTYLATFSYFFGMVALICWALWSVRSGRYGYKTWILLLATITLIGLGGVVSVLGFARLMQNLDARLMARLMRARTDPSQASTALGQIGRLELSPRIVIRLQPGSLGQPPTYLREASYRIYDPTQLAWHSGGKSNPFDEVSHAPNNDTIWLLQPGKTNKLSTEITAYLDGFSRDSGSPEGLLPLPTGSSRLERLPAFSLKMNRTGAVLATGPGLVIFDAFFGPGATIDSPPDTSSYQLDLTVPAKEVPALNQVIAEMRANGGDDLEKRLAVQAFFARRFAYSTWQGEDKLATTDASPLTRFLLTSRSGHCEYFATATVLLLRQLGIPARYAVGYYVHEVSGSGYVVRERDAHAWCLVWDRQKQIWEDFDTTPASWVAVEASRASFWDTFSDLRTWLGLQLEKLRWQQANLRQYILWTLSPVIAVLVYYIIFQRRARARAAAKPVEAETPVVWPGHDSAFYRLEEALAARGLPRQPQEALADWLERALAEPALAGLRQPLRELLQLHYRYRFDPLGLNEAEKRSLVGQVERVLGKLAQVEPAKPAGGRVP